VRKVWLYGRPSHALVETNSEGYCDRE
jgi:hypothetical protein